MTIECVCKNGIVYHNGDEVGTYETVDGRRTIKYNKEWNNRFEPTFSAQPTGSIMSILDDGLDLISDLRELPKERINPGRFKVTKDKFYH